MSDEPEPKESPDAAGRVGDEAPESADIPQHQGQPQERVIEVDKLLLRDAAGKYRGKISAQEDGSASMLLSDNSGQAWVWLGINPSGEAFLELKDRHGEVNFKVPAGSPPPEAADQPAPTPPQDPVPDSPPRYPEPPGPFQTVAMPGEGGGVPPGGLGGEASIYVRDRLDKIDRQNRRQWFFLGVILPLLVLILATQAYLLVRLHHPGSLEAQALAVQDPNGVMRAWLGAKDGKVGLDLWDRQGKRRAFMGLGPEGSPGLTLYDQEQRPRAQLVLGPDGNPKFKLEDNLGLKGLTEQHAPHDLGNQQNSVGTVPGSEKGTVTSPTPNAGDTQGKNVSPDRAAPAEVVYVGSKTSNKYHYPSCKWAKTIKPSKLIVFHSAAEAQELGYSPCPVCKPPRIDKKPPQTPGPGAKPAE